MNTRLVVLIGLLLAGCALVVALYVSRTQAPVRGTLTSAFQVFGEAVRVADRFAGRIMPVSDLDEAQLGQALKSHYTRGTSDAHAYVNELLGAITVHKHKDFDYEVHVVGSPAPNAMALPGGIVFVTSGLLETLASEAQLAFVLAHEVGHIELSHCIDKVKYEVAAQKLGVVPLGALADLAVRLMLSHSYSKTQEHEADVFAWTWITHSRYDPRGAAGSFEAMLGSRSQPAEQGPSLLRDYFKTHPLAEVRAQEYRNRADNWWQRHPDERRYVGRRNLEALQALGDGPGYPEEWVTKTDD